MTLWDTGGQERHDSLTANYYRNAHAVILVYALDEESTLYALSEWVREAVEMNRQRDHLVLALWGTKADLPSIQKTVKQEAVEAFRKSKNIADKLNCSVSLFDASLETAMLHLMEYLDNHFSTQCIVDPDPEVQDLNKLLCEPNISSSPPAGWKGCCRQ